MRIFNLSSALLKKQYKSYFLHWMSFQVRLKTLLLFAFSLLTLIVFSQSPRRYEFTEPLMGTDFQLIFYTTNDSLASLVAQAAFARVSELNQIMSDYLPNSELNQLASTAGTGKRVQVSNDLWIVLRTAQQISKQSDGAFDVSIGPLSKLWRKAFRQQIFPAIELIEAAKSKVNYQWIKLYPKTQAVELLVAGMQLDLGGIAKGYAADEAYKIFQQYGISSALIDGGGDMRIGAAPPQEAGWKVALSTDSSILILNHQAVVTSGDTYRYLEWEGKRYSHIIHPKTGMGLTNRRQVSVVAENATLADALASAICILDVKAGQKLARRFGAQVVIREELGVEY